MEKKKAALRWVGGGDQGDSGRGGGIYTYSLRKKCPPCDQLQLCTVGADISRGKKKGHHMPDRSQASTYIVKKSTSMAVYAPDNTFHQIRA